MRLTDVDFNFAQRVAKAALFTATKKDGQINTMTVSWGGSGILWGREVCFVFVRPERYTFEFCENGDTATLSFFGQEKRDTLSFCGSKSGRDVDKFRQCGLSYKMEKGACVFDDADEVRRFLRAACGDRAAVCALDQPEALHLRQIPTNGRLADEEQGGKLPHRDVSFFLDDIQYFVVALVDDHFLTSMIEYKHIIIKICSFVNIPITY
jgi:hypothetical protein